MNRVARVLRQHILELRPQMDNSGLIFAQVDLAQRGLELQMPAFLLKRTDHLPAWMAAQLEAAPHAVLEG